MFDERSWNKLLAAPLHQGSWLVPSLEAFIVRTSGQEQPHWYSIDYLQLSLLYYTGEANWCVAQAVFDERTLNKFLQAPLHPGNSIVPSLDAFIVRTSGREHPHWYSIYYLQLSWLEYTGEANCSVAQAMFDERFWYKFLQAPVYLGNSLVQRLESFIVRKYGHEHPHSYSTGILVMVR